MHDFTRHRVLLAAALLLLPGLKVTPEEEEPGAAAASLRGRLAVPASLNGVSPYPCVVDTALPRTVLHTEVAEYLGLSLEPVPPEGQRAWSATLDSLSVGDFTTGPLRCVVMPLGDLSAQLGSRIAALMPAHQPGYEVTLDFREPRVIWRPLEYATLHVPAGEVAPMRVGEDGAPRVQVLLRGTHLLTCIVDSGTPEFLVLPWAELERTGGAEPGEASLTVRLDEEIALTYLRLNEARVGGIVVDKPVCALRDDVTEPRLGLGFLARFRVTMNFEFGLIHFGGEYERRFAVPPVTGVGIGLDRQVDGLWRILVAQPSPAAAAGLRSGDLLVSVGGMNAGDAAAEDLEKRLHPPAGTSTEVVVERDALPVTSTLTSVELL